MTCRCADPVDDLNPRHNDCRKCGRPLPTVVPRRRNLDVEREITLEAARGVVDPASLITHAETRAAALSGEYVPDPMLIAPGRDRVRDSREELADCRNHLVWWQEVNLEHPDRRNAMMALRHVILAYDLLGRVE